MADAPLSVRRYTFRELSGVAGDFLSQHHPSGELPVPIEEIVEFELELDIVPVPGLLDHFDIDAFLTADLKEVRVDAYVQERVPTRYRATLAHEASHLLLHRDYYERLRFGTVGQWKAVLASLPAEDVNRLEHQASLLAALILVPPARLREEFGAALDRLPGGFDFGRLSERARNIVIGGIAGAFVVSPAMLRRRLSQDRLV
jgi:hypothetical protein